MARKKIAVLGGGIGAMAAAFEISSQPDWQRDYEITVYQLGWRLGGQGATGRDPSRSERIEEHGLHFWGGFYENAFQVMTRCYAELDRPPEVKPSTIWEAFQPQPFWTIEEYIDGRWIHWPMPFPTDDRHPGSGEVASPWELLERGIEALIGMVDGSEFAPQPPPPQPVERWMPGWVQDVRDRIHAAFGGVVPPPDRPLPATAPQVRAERPGKGPLHLADLLIRRVDNDVTTHPDGLHEAIAWLLREFRAWFLPPLAEFAKLGDRPRRLYMVVDMMTAIFAGVLEADAFRKGFSVLDDRTLIEFFKANGASDLSLGSALVRGYHDYFFAYDKGDLSQPDMAAGTALWHMMRLMLDYKGAIWWKMVAGMGDTVFGPLYEVLSRRGVRFEFFHKVTALHPTTDGGAVDSIDLQIQATLKDPSTGYRPLRTVKNLPVWPNAPLFDQLVEGETLKAQKIDLEDPWSGWPGVGTRTLRRGEDFDAIVLGTSMAPLPAITAELMEVQPAWREMVTKVTTVQTAALQIWIRPTMAEMGWTMPRPLASAYAQPLNTWSEMTHVVPFEDWPSDQEPGTVLYFCGPWPDVPGMDDFSDRDFPRREKEKVAQVSAQWLTDNSAHQLPLASISINPTALDWTLLSDTNDAVGFERLGAQYWRVNIGPYQRYVLSGKGSTASRMKDGRSPFENLFPAGDYVFTLLGGCVEAAAMGGRLAARAICGEPKVIPGEVTS